MSQSTLRSEAGPYLMPNNPNLGGLDLGALAAQGTAESAQRSQGSQAAMNSYLASMLAEQSGLLQSRTEVQSREQHYLRAQAMLDEALARREAVLQEARARAEMAFDEQQGAANRAFQASEAAKERAAQGAEADDWYARQRFQTDENIRQAQILAQMERRYQMQDRKQALKDEKRASTPRLSDFGKDEINAFRGQALANAGYKQGWLQAAVARGNVKRALAEVDETTGLPIASNPILLQQRLRQMAGSNDEAMSLALWDLLGASGANYLGQRQGR